MPLKKHFLKPAIETIPVKRWQFVLHLFATIGLALFFYLLMLYSQEWLKLIHLVKSNRFQFEFYYNLMPTTWFFKFSCAFFALLFSFTFLKRFLFHRPSFHRWYAQSRARRHRVLLFHNTRVSNHYFLDVAARFFVLIYLLGIEFWALIFKENGVCFQWIIIMALFLLYFQQWQTIGLYFRNTWKWQWRILAVTILVAIGFICIPNQKLDTFYKNRLAESYTHNYNIELMTVENVEPIYQKHLVEYGILAYPKQQDATGPVLIFHNSDSNELVTDEKLSEKLQEFINARSDYFTSRDLSICLAVGKDVEMKHLYKVWQALGKEQIQRIEYFAKFSEEDLTLFNLSFKQRLFLPCTLMDSISFQELETTIENGDFHPMHFGCYQIHDLSTIEHTDIQRHHLSVVNNQISFNGKAIPIEQLEQTLLQLSFGKTNVIELRIDDSTHFEMFLSIYDRFKNIKNQRKEDVAQQMFHMNYDDLEREQAREVSAKLNFYFTHFTPRAWEYVDFIRRKQ